MFNSRIATPKPSSFTASAIPPPARASARRPAGAQLQAAIEQQRDPHLQRNNSLTTPFFADSTNVAAELGISGTSQSPINYGPPNLSFTNFGSLSDASASLTRSQTTNFTDGINYTWKRKHNFSSIPVSPPSAE